MYAIIAITTIIASISFLFGTIIPITIPTAIATALTSLFTFLNTLDFILPLSTIGTLINLTITFELSILTFRLIMWIIALVRGNES